MRIELSEDDLSEAIGLLLTKRGFRGDAAIELKCRALGNRVLAFSAIVTVMRIEADETGEQR